VVADAGVAHDFGPRDGLVDAKVGAGGTANYLEGAAMTRPNAPAMAAGATLARERRRGCNVLGFGEMGIGNTASASLITHCITGLPLADCVGRGTGLDDAGLARKRALLAQALAAWPTCRPSPPRRREQRALRILARFGGFEIAMLAGAMLAAAERA
jgi:nicotinate-nucleotide--dimethylbenzimidazole phosphoribosyltransferase